MEKQSYTPFFRKPAFIHVIAKYCRDIFKFLSPMQINTPPQGKLIYTFVTNVTTTQCIKTKFLTKLGNSSKLTNLLTMSVYMYFEIKNTHLF